MKQSQYEKLSALFSIPSCLHLFRQSFIYSGSQSENIYHESIVQETLHKRNRMNKGLDVMGGNKTLRLLEDQVRLSGAHPCKP